jgi:hypothetical protein
LNDWEHPVDNTGVISEKIDDPAGDAGSACPGDEHFSFLYHFDFLKPFIHFSSCFPGIVILPSLVSGFLFLYSSGRGWVFRQQPPHLR